VQAVVPLQFVKRRSVISEHTVNGDHEVDLIVERDDGCVVAIVTKVATTVSRWHRVSMWPAGGLGDQAGPPHRHGRQERYGHRDDGHQDCQKLADDPVGLCVDSFLDLLKAEIRAFGGLVETEIRAYGGLSKRRFVLSVAWLRRRPVISEISSSRESTLSNRRSTF
jgi:hypothetical protein